MGRRPGSSCIHGGNSTTSFNLFIVALLVLDLCLEAGNTTASITTTTTCDDKARISGSYCARKLLQTMEMCSKDDIVIYQGPTTPLPSGIPSFTVQILNVCASDCYITNIHVSCGWFSSVRLINPQVFRRVSYDDCLVNDGMALGPGGSLSFQYANSFQYPLSVSSVDCS